MAMAQTGVPTTKVLILVGAGLTSSIILKNGKISDVLAELQDFIKGINNGSENGLYNTSALAAQIQHLAQEVKELTFSRPITIATGDSNSGGNVASFLLPAAAVGAMGYCYMRWKKLSFSDVMFVTKRNMSNAVSSVTKQLEQLSAALVATKRHLTQRIEIVDDKLDQQKEVSKVIMNEVSDVKSDLSQIGFEIEELQKMVNGLERKLGLLDDKQDMANAGILYVCQFVDGFKDEIGAKFFKEAQVKLKPKRPIDFYLEDSLKGLQFLTDNVDSKRSVSLKPNTELQRSDSLKPNTARQSSDEKPPKATTMKSMVIHRTSVSSSLHRTSTLAL